MYVLVIFIITVILMLVAYLRYRYLLKHSDKDFLHIYSAIIAGILFSGAGFIPIVESIMAGAPSEGLLMGLGFQLPLIISVIIYNILNVRHKKRIAVTTKIIKNTEWK